ncbi:MAG: helix-turn-helix domain-containing protein [Syntrophorhabdaceae bacterium]|nr:helix-turn-helix domain-containing protein [Syntrophorhabdaceae bacterium]
MNAHTNHQVVTHNGIPVAVVIPYKEYLKLTGTKGIEDRKDILSDAEIEAVRNDPHAIPDDVVGMMLKNKFSIIRAWREYLGLTQGNVARAMNVSQPVYARMESGKVNPRISTLRRIAKVFGIDAAQLDV